MVFKCLLHCSINLLQHQRGRLSSTGTIKKRHSSPASCTVASVYCSISVTVLDQQLRINGGVLCVLQAPTDISWLGQLLALQCNKWWSSFVCYKHPLTSAGWGSCWLYSAINGGVLCVLQAPTDISWLQQLEVWLSSAFALAPCPARG